MFRVDDDLLPQLRAQAIRNRRSLAAQANYLLAQAMANAMGLAARQAAEDIEQGREPHEPRVTDPEECA